MKKECYGYVSWKAVNGKFSISDQMYHMKKLARKMDLHIKRFLIEKDDTQTEYRLLRMLVRSSNVDCVIFNDSGNVVTPKVSSRIGRSNECIITAYHI